jgi:Flp pilus assembly protein protease CpaA
VLSSVVETMSTVLYLIAIVLLIRICWTDFFHLKIWNRDLLILLGVTAAFLLISWPDDLLLRLGLGAVFFALSFVFWLQKAVGAGDVKLFGLVGILIKPDQAILLLLLIMAFVLVIFVLYRKADHLRYIPQLAGRRVLELVETGRIPYGVPISLATISVMLSILIAGR